MIPLLAVSVFAVATLLIALGVFIVMLLWVIRPDGIPLLSLLAPRERGLRRARGLLASGDWKSAFAIADSLRDPRHSDPEFDRRVRYFEGDCLYQAAERSMQVGKYTEALELMRGAGDRLGLPEVEFDKRIIELLLAEIRRRVATEPASVEIERLAAEVLRITAPHPETSFWLGWHHLHGEKLAAAVEAFQDAVADENAPEAALYLGALLLRTGRPRDALRWLSQAARLAPENPVIQWQLGAAILESSGDPAAAVKALERATAPTGLAAQIVAPKLIWCQTLPPTAWLAQLTRRNPINCPLGWHQVEQSLSQARRLLATALERCNRATDAAAVYYQAFSAGDDSPAVRRGLGLSLARAGLYDDALPHLQAAHAQENPPSALTTGYLAICTARASSTTPDEHAEHLRDGIKVLTSLEVRGDVEWARLARELYREIETAGVQVSADQLRELSLILASVGATDPTAIEIYDLLAAQPSTIPHEVAALYVRSAVDRNFHGAHDAVLFARAFRDRDQLRRYFAERKWDFAQAERTYLSRWAERQPGRYPDAPGPIYAAVAERFLIDQSRAAEKAGLSEGARSAVELAQKLGPTRTMTLDRLAELAYRDGDRATALRYLDDWVRHHPNDPRPLVRRALIIFRDNNFDGALELLAEACDKLAGPSRSQVLLVTARVALSAQQHEIAEELLEQARQIAPAEADPLLALTALAWQRGDYEKVASYAESLERVRGTDPFRSFFTALAQAVAGNDSLAEAAFATAETDPKLAADVAHLRATLLCWHGQDEQARAALEKASSPVGPLADLVTALRGQLAWRTGDYPSACTAWQSTPPERRRAWQLEQPYAVASFITGWHDLQTGRPSEALDRFRAARAAGNTADLLPILECIAWQRSGAKQPEDPTAIGQSLRQMEAGHANGFASPGQAAWLARGYRRINDLAAAQRLLNAVAETNVDVELQRGLLDLAAGRLSAADKAFTQGTALADHHPALVHNLILTRLSLGKFDGLGDLLESGAKFAPTPEGRRVWLLLKAVLNHDVGNRQLKSMTPADEQRLLKRVQSMGVLASARRLLECLLMIRPDSAIFRQAELDLIVLEVKQWLDRGQPQQALLAAHGRQHRALSNLQGVAAALLGDTTAAVQHFQAALPNKGDDARVQHNLALIWAQLGDSARAARHWQAFLNAFAAHAPAPPGMPDYLYKLGNLVRQRLHRESVAI
jgi:tetratricopeptide (TPR) repeat protein